MAIRPETNLFLLKCPLELSNKHQLTFSSKQNQFNYFNSLQKLEIDNITYQRKDSVLRYPAHIDTLLEYNYCMYQNENYTNKWFYAYITNMEYVNDAMTNIYIKTDVWQTWQFNLTFKDSFVEREMCSVSDDLPGNNLIPENLETGEYKVNSTTSINELKPAYVVAYVGDTIIMPGDDADLSVNQDGYWYNGIFSSVTYIIANDYGFSLVKALMNNANNSSYILTIFSIPELAIKSKLPVDPVGTHTYYYEILDENFTQSAITKTLSSRPSSIDGYTPRNKKLLQYPFLYIGFNPQNGTQKIYRFEDFTNGTPSFKLISEINPNPTVQFIPQNYRGQTGDSMNDNACLNGYPTISYKNDTFNQWLAQNSNIINIEKEQMSFNQVYSQSQVATGLLGDVAGAFTSMLNPFSWGGVGNNVGSMASRPLESMSIRENYELNIAKLNAQIEAQKLLPDKANLSSSNATLLGYDLFQTNVFTTYSIKSQFAQRIDKYFDMFGYQTNTLKTPNINNRPVWNYVKTSGCNIEAYIPQNDLAEIVSLFDNGVTLWHDSSKFLDYSQNNRS